MTFGSWNLMLDNFSSIHLAFFPSSLSYQKFLDNHYNPFSRNALHRQFNRLYRFSGLNFHLFPLSNPHTTPSHLIFPLGTPRLIISRNIHSSSFLYLLQLSGADLWGATNFSGIPRWLKCFIFFFFLYDPGKIALCFYKHYNWWVKIKTKVSIYNFAMFLIFFFFFTRPWFK